MANRMEHAIRFVIVFLWCVAFGFFSVMGYLDDTMTAQKSTAILAGLLAGLGVYGAIEWHSKIKGLPRSRGLETTTPPVREHFSQHSSPSASVHTNSEEGLSVPDIHQSPYAK